MENKYKLLLIGVSVFFAIALGTSLFFQIKERAEISRVEKVNESFVPLWGTQKYTDLDSYKGGVKSFLAPELYSEYFGDIYSWELRKGRAISKKYEITTKIKKVSSRKKQGDLITFITVVEEKISSTEEKKSKEKTISITYQKNNEKYLVTNIKYLN